MRGSCTRIIALYDQLIQSDRSLSNAGRKLSCCLKARGRPWQRRAKMAARTRKSQAWIGLKQHWDYVCGIGPSKFKPLFGTNQAKTIDLHVSSSATAFALRRSASILSRQSGLTINTWSSNMACQGRTRLRQVKGLQNWTNYRGKRWELMWKPEEPSEVHVKSMHR